MALDINLLRDTEDPERDEKEPDRYHPPKLSDYTAKPGRGPSATSTSPRPTFGQMLRGFFGIKPKAPKPRILSKRTVPEREQRPTATVPFRPPEPMGAPPTNIPPRGEDFTVSGPQPRIDAPAPETPIAFRGEKAVEDLFAEPVVLGTPAPVKRTPVPPELRRSVPPAKPAGAPPAPPRPEDLMEEILREAAEPPEGSTVAPVAPKQPPAPIKPVVPAPKPAPRTEPLAATFEPLTIGPAQAKPVVKRNAPGGRIVPKRAESFWARVLRIATSILPKRGESLPEGEGPEDLDVNLVPEELSAKLNLGDKVISLALVTLVVAAVVGLGYTAVRIFETRIVEERQTVLGEIEEIRSRTVQLQAEQREAIAFRQRTDAIAFALGKHVRWTRFFEALEDHTEKDVYFVNFAGDLSGALTLSAFGTSYDSVARQYATFEAADDFVQTVTIGGAQRSDDGSVSFTAALQLVPTFYLAPETER